jgi:hypothetical protein
MTLTAPSFAAVVICASTLLHPNVFGFMLAPLIFLGFVMLIGAFAIASRNHERTSRGTWTLLALAGVAQVVTLMGLGAFR